MECEDNSHTNLQVAIPMLCGFAHHRHDGVPFRVHLEVGVAEVQGVVEGLGCRQPHTHAWLLRPHVLHQTGRTALQAGGVASGTMHWQTVARTSLYGEMGGKTDRPRHKTDRPRHKRIGQGTKAASHKQQTVINAACTGHWQTGRASSCAAYVHHRGEDGVGILLQQGGVDGRNA